ncbi:MAG: DUF6120 family protein [Blautia sp.]
MIKNNYCVEYYKILKELFPKLSFSEGKFLKDMKIQLRDYSLLYPNATYDDVINCFGLPEEIVAEFLKEQSSAELHTLILLHRQRRIIFHSILIALAFIVLGSFILFFTAYQEFITYKPTISETIIQEGERFE